MNFNSQCKRSLFISRRQGVQIGNKIAVGNLYMSQRCQAQRITAFCDTILILINFTAENSRWNINIFAKVFPAKSPQIHPTISEFAEWE